MSGSLDHYQAGDPFDQIWGQKQEERLKTQVARGSKTMMWLNSIIRCCQWSTDAGEFWKRWIAKHLQAVTIVKKVLHLMIPLFTHFSRFVSKISYKPG